MKKQAATFRTTSPRTATAPSDRRRLRPAGRISLLLTVAALHAAQASAIVYVMPTDESMVDRSPIIVFGEVRSAGPGERRGRPATNYVFDVEEVLKGAVAGVAIVVQQPGGVDEDGVAWWIMGLPMLEKGDRVLLFLGSEESGSHPIVEYALGMFWEVDVGGQSFLLREPSLRAGEVPTPGNPSAAERNRRRPPGRAALFRRWIEDRAAGLERPADYFETEVPPKGLAAVRSPYRLYDECGVPARLPAFDCGESLDYVVYAGGQPGVPGGGLQQVRSGMRVWNDDARSRANVRFLRTTSERLPTEVFDNGIRRIMYEDPYDEIEGAFDDDGGGGDDDGGSPGTRYDVGDVIATLPAGSWFPNVCTGGCNLAGNAKTVNSQGGYIEYGSYRYTCEASSCQIDGRTVTRGTWLETRR